MIVRVASYGSEMGYKMVKPPFLGKSTVPTYPHKKGVNRFEFYTHGVLPIT